MSVPREELADHLRSKRVEIEQALLARATAVPGGEPVGDLDYREGFHATFPAALDLSLVVIASREGEVPPIPESLLHHARLAARHRVGLNTVLRGYVAGSTLLDNFILDACDHDDIQTLLRLRAVALERLLSNVSHEYESERRSRDTSPEARLFDRIRRLLRGEPQRTVGLDYDLNSNHVAIVARGVDSRDDVLDIARVIGCRLLLVRADPDTVWAWLGSRNAINLEEVTNAVPSQQVRDTSVGIGECASGIAGWRRSHHQAKAALPVALSSCSRLARYSDVCIRASAMQDSLLTTSLRERYLQPLLAGKDNGRAHIQTLRAYFAADRNGTSTAAALGISRQAVASRLRVIESIIGQPLTMCAGAIELALILDDAASTVPAADVNSGPRLSDA